MSNSHRHGANRESAQWRRRHRGLASKATGSATGVRGRGSQEWRPTKATPAITSDCGGVDEHGQAGDAVEIDSRPGTHNCAARLWCPEQPSVESTSAGADVDMCRSSASSGATGLAEMRAEVNRTFLDVVASWGAPRASSCSGQGAERYARRSALHKLREENARLATELDRVKQSLADPKTATELNSELVFWRGEESILRLHLEDMENRQNARRVETQAETTALRNALERTKRLRDEVKRWEVSAQEAEMKIQPLRRNLDQQVALQRIGGVSTAQLFATALPALDAASLMRAREAIENKLARLQEVGHSPTGS